jgi:predicted HicB family RNase H-like nuclease
MIGDLHYKNYIGSIEYSEEDNILYGKVVGIRSLILYEGKDVDELRKDFHNAVDLYLDDCKKNDIEPEKSYKGSFNIRIDPTLHMEYATYALKNNTSLNKLVEEAMMAYVKKLYHKSNA